MHTQYSMKISGSFLARLMQIDSTEISGLASFDLFGTLPPVSTGFVCNMRRTYISVVCSNCMVFLNDLTQRQNFSNQRQSSIELQVVWSKMGTVNGSSAELDCLTNSWKFPPWKFVWPIDPSETYIDLTVGTDFKDCVYPVRLFIEWSVEFLHIAFT